MSEQRDSPAAVFPGGTEMHARCRDLDWSRTSLGPVEGWPKSLLTAMQLCLDSPTALAVWAGPDLLLIYNDAYAPTLGPGRHPWALGRSGREVWDQFWDWLGPELDRVILHGESTFHEDQRVVLSRAGREEETFFTCSHSPIRDGDRIAGSLNAVQESTERVRRIRDSEQFLPFALATARTGAWERDLVDPLAPIRNSVYILERAAPGGEQAIRARQVIEDHREVFARSGVDLETVDAGKPLWIDGDRTRLAQVIGDLLTNSAKFTPRGGKTVLTVEESANHHAVVRVRDNGAGMSRDTQERLFEPFVQAAQTIERTRGGLGLGLALVKGLVELHDGTARPVAKVMAEAPRACARRSSWAATR